MSDYCENKETLCHFIPEELSHIILRFKCNLECDEVREEMIERDFYNWLNHDVPVRNSYKRDIFSGAHCDFYIKNYINLGLNSITHIHDNLRRTKSLSGCYKSQWWKLTEKNHVSWNYIHKTLNMFRDDFIFIWNKDIDFRSEDVLDMLSTNWRRPLFKEKLKIVNKYSLHELELFHSEWLLTREPLLFSIDISMIL